MLRKVSIIIPAYNAENYIAPCIKSIQCQDYPELEIIVVDDGSIDNTYALTEEFANDDSRIILLHKENGGQSSARNLGLSIATGEYFTFVDSDDVISESYICNLVNAIEKYQADISMCGMTIINGNKKKNKYCYNNLLLCGRDIIVKEYLKETYMFGPTCKLFKASIFKNERFINGTIFEDVEYLSRIYLKTNTVILTNGPDYYYYIRKNSTIHSAFNQKKIDLLNMTGIIRNNILASGIACKEELNLFTANSYLSFLLLCLDSNKMSEYRSVCEPLQMWLTNNKKDLLKSKIIGTRLKIYIRIFTSSSQLFIQALSLGRKLLK